LALLGKRFGEAQAQQIVGFAGLFNGCRFCGIGHNLTANMMIFRERKVLYPIDEADVPHLQTLRDEEILAHFRERLAGTEFASDMAIYERMLALRNGTTSDAHENDLYLKAALDLWVWNNECSIEVGLDIEPEKVPAFLNWPTKDAVYRAYREARGTA
jgi:hypothetical protein